MPATRSRKQNGDKPPGQGQVDVHALRAERKEARKQLKLWRRPLRTLQLFLFVLLRYLKKTLFYVVTHPVTLFVGLPLLVLLVVANFIPGSHHAYLDALEEGFLWCSWWIMLGVLSSVGLGTGMHSGILFLFPFIAEVCLAANTCQSLRFDTYGEHAFICPPEEERDPHSITFFAIFSKVWFVAFLWGAGTAIGEIPPYAVSRASRLAGDSDEEWEEINAPSKFDMYNRMKVWMFDLLHRHGFWAILAFASWPNMAFDLCGIACGHFLLPFWTFFGATFIGKALIKVSLQTAFFVVLFSEHLLINIIALLHSNVSVEIASQLSNFLSAQKEKFLSGQAGHQEPKEKPLFAVLWGWVMVLFILGFVLSIVESFAQNRQAEIDESELDAIDKAQHARAETRKNK